MPESRSLAEGSKKHIDKGQCAATVKRSRAKCLTRLDILTGVTADTPSGASPLLCRTYRWLVVCIKDIQDSQGFGKCWYEIVRADQRELALWLHVPIQRL